MSAEAPAETPALLAIVNGRCVYYDQAARRCRIHNALGHEALPLACRQFPRVTVRDPRGVSVTLSAYCPTAAALLDTDDAVRIVESPAAFPESGEYVGLDAGTALPPLLTPDRMMDWDSWWRWESMSVTLLAEHGQSALHATAALRLAVDDIVKWSPNEGRLDHRVRSAFDRATSVHAPFHERLNRLVDPSAISRRSAEVYAAVPFDLRNGVEDRPPTITPDRIARRYLASHAFANWSIHLGGGLEAWMRSIETAQALLAAGLSVREADLRLRHLADPVALANARSYSSDIYG